MSSILLVAAEASSALFAQRLLEQWKTNANSLASSAQFFGVGSKAMEDLGFHRLGRSEDMAVVGLAEVIEHYTDLKKVFNDLVAAAAAQKPKVAVLMDYPDFNLRLAKELKALGIPVVYYITPQVWAWRRGRAQKIKQYCDQVFVLFPFEKKFFEQVGVPCEFVGHPLLDELNPKYLDSHYQNLQRAKFGIAAEDIVIGLMPGSRRAELKHHTKIQIEVARRLLSLDPRIKIVILCAPTVTKERLLEEMGDVRFPYILLKNEPLDMICLVDVMLAASGTATLQVGLLEKPMVVMYKFKWLTGLLAKILVRGVKYFCIVNLIFDREVVPERWQERAKVEELLELMKKILNDPAEYQRIKNDLHQLQFKLGDRGASERVVRQLQRYFQ